MRNLCKQTAIIALICLNAAAALGFQPMAATVRVENGTLYDYVNIGEQPKATDGYDNAYDTISPGNLNADMGLPFISAVIVHPEWKAGLRELRGDMRPPAKRQEWQLLITSSLARGTPLTVGLQPEQSRLPKGVQLILREKAGGKEINLTAGKSEIPAPGPGAKSTLHIIAEQP